jgi:hypothetical protein
MKAEKLSTEIAALERQSSKAKNAVLKKVLAKKIDKLKTELESITSEETAKDKIKKAKTKVNAMDAKEFNVYIKELAKNPDFSFLKSMTSSEIVRDIKRTAKPVGWRFRGRKNVKTPTKKDIKDKNNVYYEGRRNRSDVSRKIRLKDGGVIAEGDKVTITTSSLGKEYQGMNGTIIERKLINGKYSVKLDNGLTIALSKNEFKHNSINPRFKDGGGVDDEGIDLFEDYEDIPQNLQNILDKYMQKFDDDFGNMDYNDMADMHDEVYEIGYTFESGLDNQPYDLRPIGTKGKSEVEEYKNGGGVEKPNEYERRHLNDFPEKSVIVYDDKNGLYKEKAAKISIDYSKNYGGSFSVGVVVDNKIKVATLQVLPNGEVILIKGEKKNVYADGGGVDLNDWDMPVIRTQFEDEEFEYAQGGETGEPHRSKMNNMMKDGGNVEKYPELRKIADRIAEKTAVMINAEIKKVSSKMPYKAQWVLEEVIKDLESRV